MLKIIEDSNEWNQLLNYIGAYDYYQTFEYNTLEAKRQQAQPLFLAFLSEEKVALFPLLTKRIFNSKFYDITSSYGYAGPITSTDDPFFIQSFNEALRIYLSINAITAAFTRLNPILSNESYLSNIGEVVEISRTVAIDLTLSDQEQLKKYRKGHRYTLKKNVHVSCRFANWSENSTIFIDLYYDTMQRLKADDQYYFKEDYFNEFFQADSYLPMLVICEIDQEVIGAAIFVGCQGIIQYHLSGVKEKYISFSPALMMIDYIRNWGSHNDYRILHLGGGYANSDDTLFRFKSGFSDNYCSYSIWKYVVSEAAYLELCHRRGIDAQATSFFPAYRSNSRFQGG